MKTYGLVEEPILLHLLHDERAECFADEGGEEGIKRRLLLEEAVKLVHYVRIFDHSLLQRRHIAGDDLAGHIGIQKALLLWKVGRRLGGDQRN